LTAIENASLRSTLEAQLKKAREIGGQEREQLLEVLKSWKLPKIEDTLEIPTLHETVRHP
jgi:hypothetical protein